MNYIILNDVNSNTIQGLLIQNLPPITKPKIRTNIEEIDGRDGDIITKLGYSAYDKEFDIGLYGNYDVDQVISYFNSEGTVIFSNEDDKFYKYTIIEQIDFERLIRFKTAKVKMHVQPFKYSDTDEDIEIYATETDAEGTNLTINNTENGASFLDMQLKGQTSQTTYQGYNLLNVNTGSDGLTLVDNNYYITNVNQCYVVKTGITLNANTTYYYKFKLLTRPSTATTFTTYLDGTPDTSIGFSNINRADNFNLNQVYTRTITPTTNKVMTITQYGNSNSEKFQFQLWLTTDNSKNTFEPYVGGIASPNPSYPQNVNVVTGNAIVNISNKNLVAGLEYGDINSSTGAESSSTTILRTTNYIPYSTTDTYYQSLDGAKLSAGTNFRFYNKDKVYIGYGTFGYQGGITNPTITIGSGVTTTDLEPKYFRVRMANTNVPSETSNYMVAKSSDLTYVAHQEQNYEINLGTNELCQIGGYQDYIHKNNGNWFIHKEIGKIVLDDSYNWTRETSSTWVCPRFICTTLPDLGTTVNGTVFNNSLCNMATVGSTSDYTQNENVFLLRRVNNTNRIDCMFDLASVDDLKSILANEPMLVYYGLITPTETQITDENLIAQLEALRNASTYINQTNIITSGDLAPIIYVNVDTIDTNAIEVVNSGNIYSKPVVTITGIGTINLYLNDYQVFILELGDTETTITLDVENMEAYNINTGQLMNRQVTGNYNNFIFNAGTNIITWSGTIASVQVVNYSRWI